jgi:hypothetical protein
MTNAPAPARNVPPHVVRVIGSPAQLIDPVATAALHAEMHQIAAGVMELVAEVGTICISGAPLPQPE